MPKKNLKTCKNGHQFYKSSDCPVCPICEKDNKPVTGFLSLISAPARRALENKGIRKLQQLSNFSEKDILALHGMGPKAISILQKALAMEDISFKTN